ncbi:MAG: hypothetical protein MUO59_03510 [Actinobacteria bacterium]|nr:hypothetical protein [Actinomycetota bacterium]
MSKNIRNDEMWCPECGAPVKKGFFTCANCKLKVGFTKDINKKQDKEEKSRSTESKGSNDQNNDPAMPGQTEDVTVKPEAAAVDKEKNELLDDIPEEDALHQENKIQGGRPGWWRYS